jgi:transposase
MPLRRKRAVLLLESEARDRLERISKSRVESASAIERAQMLLGYAGGESISSIVRRFRTNRPKVERCIDKALAFGALAALSDIPRSGRSRTITPEARAWVVSLACQKPKDLGYSYELWTTRLLSQHIRKHCLDAGHSSLASLARGTVSKMLRQSKIRPHKITYYLQRRDPEFESKMAQVLFVYKEVEMASQTDDASRDMVAFLSYDEKPGIQAIANTCEDLPPVVGKQASHFRDYEYKRHGTVSLLAGIDLLTGQVHGLVRNRHRSVEFIEFLKLVDSKYPKQMAIRVVLDNHSAHISKETCRYLASVPNRFEFVLTPTHGSWLNLIESFFAKMTKTFLRGIRVKSKAELVSRIEQYLTEVNQTPVVFRWKYALDSIVVQQAT